MEFLTPQFLMTLAVNMLALGFVYGAMKVEIWWIKKLLDEVKGDVKSLRNSNV